MIDLEKAKQAFSEYVKPYDINNPKIALKIEHTYRTVEVAKKIAETLNLDEEQIKLAGLIGLLHDIGRFEQLRIYDTFWDKDSIDHGDFAVKILFEDRLIRNFIQEEKYDETIYKAIKNHNKFIIEEGLTKEELIHAKIIRDADKTDIFVVFVKDIEENKNVLYDYEKVSKQEIDKIIMKDFENHRQSDRNNFKNDIDDYINIIGFIFDYNFSYGLNIIKENYYIERVIKPIYICEETKEQLDKIVKIANTYLEERIKKGC